MHLEYKMYAIVEDGRVVDLAFDNYEKITSPMTLNTYNNEEYTIIEMTQENSPAFLNGTWDGQKFYEKNNEVI
jgi:hypothetical protein